MDSILVVDDDELIVQALMKILESQGYAVKGHTDPTAAALETGFQLVISDYMMPSLNGIELLALLKQTNPRSMRLMLTAANDFQVAVEAINRGEIYRLLSKPWNLAELVSCVRQSLEHYHLSEENRRLGGELLERNIALTELNLGLERRVVERTHGLLDGLISALDHRDTETQWHSRRVSLYARRLAEQAGLDGPALDVVEQGALLHDIGKIGVRDSVLLKAGPLTPEEWTQMRRHPEIGFRMLSRLTYLRDVALIVYHHQERWDGKGYPLGLRGEQIVVGARIFAIVDALDAITSDRPYRRAQPLEVAKREIRRCGGSQFDPKLAQAFEQVPDDDWLEVRQLVAGLEREELRRWAELPDGAGTARAAG